MLFYKNHTSNITSNPLYTSMFLFQPNITVTLIFSIFITNTLSVGYFIGTDTTDTLTASEVCNNAGGRLAIINSHPEFTEASFVASSSGYLWVVVALRCPSRDTTCSESPSKWKWFDSQNNNEDLCDISVGGMDDFDLYQTWDQWNKKPGANEYCVEFYSGKLVLEICANVNGIIIGDSNAALCQPLSYDISDCTCTGCCGMTTIIPITVDTFTYSDGASSSIIGTTASIRSGEPYQVSYIESTYSFTETKYIKSIAFEYTYCTRDVTGPSPTGRLILHDEAHAEIWGRSIGTFDLKEFDGYDQSTRTGSQAVGDFVDYRCLNAIGYVHHSSQYPTTKQTYSDVYIDVENEGNMHFKVEFTNNNGSIHLLAADSTGITVEWSDKMPFIMTDVGKGLIVAACVIGGICVVVCIGYLLKPLCQRCKDRKKRSVSETEIVSGEADAFQTDTHSTRKSESVSNLSIWEKCPRRCGCFRTIAPYLPIIAYILQFPAYLGSIIGLIGDSGNVSDSCTSICHANEGYYDYSICEYTDDADTFSDCGDRGGAIDDTIGCYPFEDSSDWLLGWKHADCWDYDYDEDKCESITCEHQCTNACNWKIWTFVSIVLYSVITEFPTAGETTEGDHVGHRFITKGLGWVMAYGNRCMMYGISTSPGGIKSVCLWQFGYFLFIVWFVKEDFFDLRTDFKLAKLQNVIIYLFGFSFGWNFILNVFIDIDGLAHGLVPLSDVWAVFAFENWSANMMFSISIFGVTMENILEALKQISFCCNKQLHVRTFTPAFTLDGCSIVDDS
eukprot:1037279_1